jgi:hypothetical protein
MDVMMMRPPIPCAPSLVPCAPPPVMAQATLLCLPPPLTPTVWSAPMPMGVAQAMAMEPCDDSLLAKMMAKYRQACAAGEKEKAAAYADCCLAIDPTCFAK